MYIYIRMGLRCKRLGQAAMRSARSPAASAGPSPPLLHARHVRAACQARACRVSDTWARGLLRPQEMLLARDAMCVFHATSDGKPSRRRHLAWTEPLLVGQPVRLCCGVVWCGVMV
jgi:hypothetical protein